MNNSTLGIMVDIPPANPPTGVYNAMSKPITQGAPVEIALTDTSTGSNIWDVIGKITDEAKIGQLLGAYTAGKVTKELNKGVAPGYTTTGNPADQPGGTLMSDIATQQQNSNRNLILYGVGGLLVLGVIVLIARR